MFSTLIDPKDISKGVVIIYRCRMRNGSDRRKMWSYMDLYERHLMESVKERLVDMEAYPFIFVPKKYLEE